MSGLAGPVLTARMLADQAGHPLLLTIVRPDRTSANAQVLLQVAQGWDACSRRPGFFAAHPTIAFRAYFAGVVAFLAAQAMRETTGCVLVGCVPTGVAAIALYHGDDADGGWWLDFLTIDPEDLDGFPSPTRPVVRGIGSAMVGAVLTDMVQTRCATVRLEALDRAAAAYWVGRGFRPTGRPDRPYELSCPEALVQSVILSPDRDQDQTAMAAGDRNALARGSWGRPFPHHAGAAAG